MNQSHLPFPLHHPLNYPMLTRNSVASIPTRRTYTRKSRVQCHIIYCLIKGVLLWNLHRHRQQQRWENHDVTWYKERIIRITNPPSSSSVWAQLTGRLLMRITDGDTTVLVLASSLRRCRKHDVELTFIIGIEFRLEFILGRRFRSSCRLIVGWGGGSLRWWIVVSGFHYCGTHLVASEYGLDFCGGLNWNRKIMVTGESDKKTMSILCYSTGRIRMFLGPSTLIVLAQDELGCFLGHY